MVRASVVLTICSPAPEIFVEKEQVKIRAAIVVPDMLQAIPACPSRDCSAQHPVPNAAASDPVSQHPLSLPISDSAKDTSPLRSSLNT